MEKIIIDYYPEEKECPCGKKLVELKTDIRCARAIQYGTFYVRSFFSICSVHRYLISDGGRDKVRLLKYVPEIPQLTRSRSPFPMELVCFVGTKKFLEAKRRDDIQNELKKQHGVKISAGSITNLSVEFLIRVKCVHELNFGKIVGNIHADGGYILGVDGTGDGGSDRLLIQMNLLRDWVLLADQIPSESDDNISPVLMELIENAGPPLCTVADMGGGIEDALKTVLPPSVPRKSCHYHFTDDVGSDMMKEEYLQFRQLFINTKVRPTLVRIRKNLKQIAEEVGVDIKHIVESVRTDFKLKGTLIDDIIMSQTYDAISWILRYGEDNHGLRFPYVLSYLDLYDRCVKGFTLMSENRKNATLSRTTPKYLHRLETLLEETAIGTGEKARKLAALAVSLRKNYSLFEELRRILRIPKEKGDIPRDGLIVHNNKLLTQTREELEQFRDKLRSVPEDNEHHGEKIVLAHLDKYWDKIIPENIEVTVNGQRVMIYVPRTVAGCDTIFGKIKSDIRMRLGKKDTSYELNRYGKYLSYVQNLRSKDYVTLMYGSLEKLKDEFEKIPKEMVENEMKKFRENAQGYDITKIRRRRGKRIEFDDLIKGILKLREKIEERLDEEHRRPPELYGRKPNANLTL